MRLLHKHDPHLELFSNYDTALRQLTVQADAGSPSITNQSASSQSVSSVEMQACLRHFELNLLDALGYALALDFEHSTQQRVKTDAHYDYTLEQGLVRVQDNPLSDISAVRVQGKTLLALAQRALSSQQDASVYREARQLMRMVLDHYLGHQPLNSRQLFAAPRKMLSPDNARGQ